MNLRPKGSTNQVDAIIVGGGLAGLAAASRIASSSRASLALVERLGIGSNDPTPMTFAGVLERFELEDCVIGRYCRFTFHSPLGNRSSHEFNGYSLVAFDYRLACNQLFERADRAGDVALFPNAANSLTREGELWRVDLNNGCSLRAPLVIDASGKGMFSARALNLSRPKSFSHSYGARFSGADILDPGETFFFAPSKKYGSGGGWLYPLSGGRASFGFAVVSSDPTLPGGALQSSFRRALAEFEPYATWFKQAERKHVEVGTIPIYPVRRFVYDGLMITGDAAGQATIWSCMGTEAALEAGRMAGEAAVRALQIGKFDTQSLALYQREWDARNRRVYRNNAWIAPVVWSQTEEDWNRQIPRFQQLSPEQALARLRVNWPVPTPAQAFFVRGYDLAGRARRGLLRRLQAERVS